MPTPRKRIGFLPRTEVQNIIDKICEHNKLSQSKVTGILVEESLIARGILNNSNILTNLRFEENLKESKPKNNNTLNCNSLKHNDNFKLNEISIIDEVQMINDFIEFKLFKKIMNSNKEIL